MPVATWTRALVALRTRVRSRRIRNVPHALCRRTHLRRRTLVQGQQIRPVVSWMTRPYSPQISRCIVLRHRESGVGLAWEKAGEVILLRRNVRRGGRVKCCSTLVPGRRRVASENSPVVSLAEKARCGVRLPAHRYHFRRLQRRGRSGPANPVRHHSPSDRRK